MVKRGITTQDHGKITQNTVGKCLGIKGTNEIFIEISSKTKEWFNLGAKMFGGCCRTSPEDIRKIRNELESLL